LSSAVVNPPLAQPTLRTPPQARRIPQISQPATLFARPSTRQAQPLHPRQSSATARVPCTEQKTLPAPLFERAARHFRATSRPQTNAFKAVLIRGSAFSAADRAAKATSHLAPRPQQPQQCIAVHQGVHHVAAQGGFSALHAAQPAVQAAVKAKSAARKANISARKSFWLAPRPPILARKPKGVGCKFQTLARKAESLACKAKNLAAKRNNFARQAQTVVRKLLYSCAPTKMSCTQGYEACARPFQARTPPSELGAPLFSLGARPVQGACSTL